MEDDHTSSSFLSSPEDLPDCPICLDEMKEADLRHPLQCSNHCGYNFCRSCIQSLISSSQDDYVEASDGSKQVKVFLHCPNCRADLSSSIRDTVLLRKAAEADEKKRQKELRDSTRGMKEALNDVLVKEALEEAKLRETQFFGYHTSSSTESDYSDESDEGWGFEADLENGVHQSFRCPHRESFRDDNTKRILLVDATLLGGLAGLMTEHQQEKVTDLFTSGDPDQLVEGAELLRCISQEFNPNPAKSRKRSMSKRGSVYRLIADVQQAHKRAENNNLNPAAGAPPVRSKLLRRQMEVELRQQAEYIGTHPLPVRMPKSVELALDGNNNNNNNSCDNILTFVDDVWDGTIDCFNKLTIGFDGKVHKNAQPKHHKGVRNILGYDGPVRIDVNGSHRVVVSSVKADCGRQGILKGDVLTHVNGELWSGTAAKLQDLIKSASGGRGAATIRLSFNCGPSVAEALKRRSLVP
eukprot:scaffold9933_cov226-Amphora_coffeaeformis.AAC.4